MDGREGKLRQVGCPGSQSPISACSLHCHRPRGGEWSATGHMSKWPQLPLLWARETARNKDGQRPVAVTSHVCLYHHRIGREQPRAPALASSVASYAPCLLAVAHSPCHPEDTLPPCLSERPGADARRPGPGWSLCALGLRPISESNQSALSAC